MSTKINTTVIFILRDGTEIKHEYFFSSPKAANQWALDLGEAHDTIHINTEEEIIGYRLEYAFIQDSNHE
jgi:hypothetical protein